MRIAALKWYTPGLARKTGADRCSVADVRTQDCRDVPAGSDDRSVWVGLHVFDLARFDRRMSLVGNKGRVTGCTYLRGVSRHVGGELANNVRDVLGAIEFDTAIFAVRDM